MGRIGQDMDMLRGHITLSQQIDPLSGLRMNGDIHYDHRVTGKATLYKDIAGSQLRIVSPDQFSRQRGSTCVDKHQVEISAESRIGIVFRSGSIPGYLIATYPDAVARCPLRIVCPESVGKVETDLRILLLLVEVFGTQAYDSIRALLKIPFANIQIYHGIRARLVAFFFTVKQKHFAARGQQR